MDLVLLDFLRLTNLSEVVVLVSNHDLELVHLVIHMVKSGIQVEQFLVSVRLQVIDRCVLGSSEIGKQALEVLNFGGLLPLGLLNLLIYIFAFLAHVVKSFDGD